MISSSQIRAALTSRLVACGLFQSVINRPAAELSAALETLRSSPDSLAIIVSAGGNWEYEMAVEDDNHPARAEHRRSFDILITTRDLRHAQGDAVEIEDLVDAVTKALLWQNLTIPHLLILPGQDEPMIIEKDDQRGRQAWKITIEARYQIYT